MTQPASTALVRAIRASFTGFAGLISIEELESRNWASVTFSGQRHRLRLGLEGVGAGVVAARFLDGLSEREFDLVGHILVDIVCAGADHAGETVTLTLEALTIEAD